MKRFRTTFTINDHFHGKQEIVREIYNELLRKLRASGPLVEQANRMSIHLIRTTTLAGLKIRSNYLILTFKSDRSVESPRIRRIERVSLNSYHLKMKLKSPADINDEVMEWLGKAYALSA